MRPHIAAVLLTIVLPGCGETRKVPEAAAPLEQPQPMPPLDRVPLPVPGPGEIVGVVFEDRNRNGVFEVGETGMNRQTVRLTDRAGADQLQSVTSGTDGSFRFDRLTADDYRLTLKIPEGFQRTTDDSFVVRIVAGGPGQVAQFGVVRR